MKTKGDCLALFLRYLDEATKKGVDLPSNKNADYRDKFNYFLDGAQKFVAGIVKIPDVFQVTQFPIPNMLGLMQGFDSITILPHGMQGTTSPYEVVLNGCKAFYLEVNNPCTVEFKDFNGNVLKNIINTSKNKFVSYKGNLAGQAVKVVYSSDYPFTIRNTGYYACSFPSDDDVPCYVPYVEHEMPSDFMEFDMVINKSDPRVYEAFIAYRWENNKKVILNYDNEGSFDIHYFKYPATILPTASDSTALEVEDKAIDMVVLQAGIRATAGDNEELSSYLQNMYDRLENRIKDNGKLTDTSIQTIYFMGG